MIGLVYNYGSIAYTDKLETNIEKRVQVPTTGRGKRKAERSNNEERKEKRERGRERGASQLFNNPFSFFRPPPRDS